MGNLSFAEKLASATNEDKQVNPIYVQEISKILPRVSNNEARIDTGSIVYPHIKTDGIYRCYCIDDEYGVETPFLLQIECKLDVDFSIPKDRANVLTQVCCYLEQIHDDIVGYDGTWEGISGSLPKVVVLGSKVNCMALPVSLLLPHAIGHISGYKSASTAHLKPENELKVSAIEKDASIQAQSIIYQTSDKQAITRLCEEIVKLGKGLKITDDLTEHTMSLAFDFFDMYVLDNKSAQKITSREKVDLFIGTFFNEEFEESTSRGASSADKLTIHGVSVKVDPAKYNQFKILYSMRDYSRIEQKQITAITDRLIEDTDRRRKGDFYTPSIWVDEAHKLLDRNLGENWRDEYMVWDCAWGTGNLTRDYYFADLYCSTIHQEDLNIATRYNKEACKFQYDFLNDDVMEMDSIKYEFKRPFIGKWKDMAKIESYFNFSKITELYIMAVEKNIITEQEAQAAYQRAVGILKSTKLYSCAPTLINGLLADKPKKLLFFINPPYKATGGHVGDGRDRGEGVAETAIKELMNDRKLGGASKQLYTQFMFRIIEIVNLFGCEPYLALFSSTIHITSAIYEKFREYSVSLLNPVDGFMLQASQFANASDTWGITFNLYKKDDKKYDIINRILDNQDGKIVELQRKKLYSTDGFESLSDVIKEKQSGIDYPQMTSALNVYDKPYKGKWLENGIGFLWNHANNIEQSQTYVSIFTSAFKWGDGLCITAENFEKCIAVFSARRLVEQTWYNWQDEFIAPNTTNSLYKSFVYDGHVLSLFNGKSNQSSLRNIEYNGNLWNIQNEFFWLSVKEMENLAGGKYSTDDINTAIEDDIEAFGKERFVYKKLQTVTLSPDAQAVLDKATELVKSSFKYRKEFNQKHPEYHINTWDAGWYQIKGLLKEYDPNGLKQFNELYKALEDRMRPLVYELGFLYK